MPRAGTRSQAQPSQSQPRQAPSQSQRTRRARVEVEEEPEDGPSQVNGDDDDDLMDAEDGEKGPDELVRKAYDLVRLALFCEQRRVPMKRDEISKKVLGTSPRAFNTVFANAQNILRNTFGMELVELQANPKGGDEETAKLMKNTGVKKRAAPTGTKTYILRSTLDPALIELANAADPDLLAEERVEYEDAEAVDELDLRTYGSILAWNTSDQLGTVGILYIILALILVEGRVLSDNDLKALLKRLRLAPSSTVPLTTQSTKRTFSTDDLLKELARQGFLDRQRVGEPARGGKRGRPSGTQAPDEQAAAFEWRWGPRAHSEVGEKAVAQFVAEFMVERPAAEEDEGERRPQREDDPATKKQMELMMRGIERGASGAALADIR
ncbi:MAGE-domain-containing protein [Obba rivulosa]|uniref:MAGE-domain-containing protein n=1 Tax=Obba rivulosa TaxID=1052685 RepID=A0A8E2DNX7_9APHY|nr:MAGE-domain-containing protein [Obba rivulosa]